jgi:flagellar assembly protein FliH
MAIVPKEQQSAYQRWELGSFDAPVQPKIDPAVQAERARELRLRAQAEGYAAGHREGLEAGFEEGRRAGLAEAAPRVAQLDAVVGGLASDLSRIDRELAQEVVALGLAVARKLVGESLRAHPEAVRESVEEALRQVAHIRGPVTVAVHPDDAALIQAHLEIAPPRGGWSVREDSGIAPGGCRIETGAGEVDGTLSQRWHRITAALGQPSEWIE